MEVVVEAGHLEHLDLAQTQSFGERGQLPLAQRRLGVLQAMQVLDQQVGTRSQAFAQRIDALPIDRSDLPPLGLETRLAGWPLNGDGHGATRARPDAVVVGCWVVHADRLAVHRAHNMFL